MELYHNDNTSDVDILSTHSDGTKAQPQSTVEGNDEGKNADTSYKLMPVIEWGLYTSYHCGIHL